MRTVLSLVYRRARLASYNHYSNFTFCTLRTGRDSNNLIYCAFSKKQKINVIVTFTLSTIVTSFVEYFSAVFAAHFFSQYKFWDYSTNFFNLNGYISLQTSLVFGLAATAFIYWVYPFCQSYFLRLKNSQISTVFWILLILYAIDLTISCINLPAYK